MLRSIGRYIVEYSRSGDEHIRPRIDNVFGIIFDYPAIGLNVDRSVGHRITYRGNFGSF